MSEIKLDHLKTWLALLPIACLGLVYLLGNIALTSVKDEGALALAAIFTFFMSFFLEYLIRLMFLLFGLNYVVNQCDKKTKYLTVTFMVVWLICFPNLMMLSSVARLPAFLGNYSIAMYTTIYLTISALPYLILGIKGINLRKAKKGYGLKISDIVLLASILIYIGLFYSMSDIFTDQISSNTSISNYSDNYAKAHKLLEKDAFRFRGTHSRTEIFKEIINYSEIRNDNAIIKYFHPSGLLANYYYTYGRDLESQLKPYTGYSNAQRSAMTKSTPSQIKEKIITNPREILNSIYGDVNKSCAKIFYLADEYKKNGSAFYSYAVSRTEQIDFEKLITVSQHPEGSMTYGIYTDLSRSNQSISTFNTNVGFNYKDKRYKFYASEIVSYYPGPRKIRGPINGIGSIIMLIDTATDTWYIFDITMQDIFNELHPDEDTPTEAESEKLEYVGKYHKLD
jgi:hypothetical protein